MISSLLILPDLYLIWQGQNKHGRHHHNRRATTLNTWITPQRPFADTPSSTRSIARYDDDSNYVVVIAGSHHDTVELSDITRDVEARMFKKLEKAAVAGY